MKTRYPSRTTDGTSSTTDYEQLVLDDAGNVTERRLRGYASDATKMIGYTYDDLNRVTHKNLPGSEPDIDYIYDNLGRLTAANQTAGTNDLSFGYDALGGSPVMISSRFRGRRVSPLVGPAASRALMDVTSRSRPAFRPTRFRFRRGKRKTGGSEGVSALGRFAC